MWIPDLDLFEGPRYKAVVDALAKDIEAGTLAAGERLPTHRDLAGLVGVSLGTVTRAYAEAERRGLVVGEVGRGTFVRDFSAMETSWPLASSIDASVIDLSLLVPPTVVGEAANRALTTGLATLANRSDLFPRLGYQPHAGAMPHREAGAAWIGRAGLEAPPENVLLCGCAQHALTVVMSQLARPGDTILTGALTNPGMKDLAGWMGLRLHGLPLDAEGLVPDAFEEACRAGIAKTLYCMPTFQNPTTGTMSLQRREQIAAIAQTHGVVIVEDGVHGLLARTPLKPVSAFAPDTSFYITSFSKTVTPGLRLGYLYAPREAVERLELAIRATMWMASPLLAEIAVTWIHDGTADRITEGKRREAAARQALARQWLGHLAYKAQPTSYHLWLPLPEPWRSSDFVAHAGRQGVAVTSPEVFIAGRSPAPHAVRLCLSAARNRPQLEQGLDILATILEQVSQPGFSVV